MSFPWGPLLLSAIGISQALKTAEDILKFSACSLMLGSSKSSMVLIQKTPKALMVQDCSLAVDGF